ncbi:hypothetical protein DYB35_001550 [Aphanomyces astaci]|uniref:RRM domain-containing protein n=1 Tax=Aphanomyces astaci TaxID=112090 RepID=A0A3R7BH98_APHAT|nr:hypothetical protein DYB35_001550 [Aphanomyces astaci]
MHSAYSYIYTQQVLLQLDQTLSTSSVHVLPYRSKLERLRQTLHEAVLTAHGDQKLDSLHVLKRAGVSAAYPALSEAIAVESAGHRTSCAFVLAYAATVQDTRPLLATTTDDQAMSWDEAQVHTIAAALEAASTVCKSETTLSYNSDAVDKLVRSMAIPVVSMGILHWLQLLVASKTFYNGPFFHAAFPVVMSLLRQAIALHVGQWPTVFQVLVTSVRLQPESNPVKVLETKKETLRCMVHLMTCGYIFPVLHFIATQTDDLDQALLRHFIQLVLMRIAPPYSLRFTTVLSDILLHPKVSQALRTCPVETKAKLKEFAHVCQAEDELAADIRLTLRETEFKKYFSQYGKVVSAEVMFNRETNKSRGFGFVIFETEHSVDLVLQDGGHVLDGKSVEVKRAVPRTDAPPPSSSSSSGVPSVAIHTQAAVSTSRGSFSDDLSSTPKHLLSPRSNPPASPASPAPLASVGTFGGYAAAVRYGGGRVGHSSLAHGAPPGLGEIEAGLDGLTMDTFGSQQQHRHGPDQSRLYGGTGAPVPPSLTGLALDDDEIPPLRFGDPAYLGIDARQHSSSTSHPPQPNPTAGHYLYERHEDDTHSGGGGGYYTHWCKQTVRNPIVISVSEPETRGSYIKKYTTYAVRQGSSSGVRRRFSDFSWLHATLAGRYVGMLIPSMPEKVVYKSDACIRSRMRGLTIFVNQIMRSPYLRQDAAVVGFLGVADDTEWGHVKKKLEEKCSALSKDISELHLVFNQWKNVEFNACDDKHTELNAILSTTTTTMAGWHDVQYHQPVIHDLMLHEGIKYIAAQVRDFKDILKQRDAALVSSAQHDKVTKPTPAVGVPKTHSYFPRYVATEPTAADMEASASRHEHIASCITRALFFSEAKRIK